MNIEQEIKEAVAKHLPQALGEELQKRLRKADEDAAKVVQLSQALQIEQKENQRLSSEVSRLDTELGHHGALAAREAVVAKREHDADLVDLRVQLAAAEGNKNFAQTLALSLVRNVEYRSSVLRTENRSEPIIPVNSNYPVGTATSTGSESTDTTNVAA